jgi:hypothetical protein
MVEAAEWVHEAMDEPAGGPHPDMGESGGWNEAKRKE